MEVYDVEELTQDVLAFGLLKVAVLSLTLKVMIMEDVLNSVLYGLTIQQQLALFEV
jgi:hypothetical protein